MLFLVTGVAGFIGHNIALRLLRAGHRVVGVDNLNDYYTVELKQARLERLQGLPGFRFERLDLAEPEALLSLPERDDVDRVIHLAAQAGVRHSIEAPFDYARSNLLGHLSVLEFCRLARHRPLLVYASSSSVYGKHLQAPFRESDPVNLPESLYAATKCADELMSSSYASLYGLEQIGVRFFTVYGAWGRPDMAYWIFTDKILRGEPIRVFNHGDLLRDFTYIEDVLDGIEAMALREPRFESDLPHTVYNIGHNRPVRLMDFIAEIERAVGREAVKIMEPMQPGDVPLTCADITRAARDYGYAPKTPLSEGIAAFVEWFHTWKRRSRV